MIKETKNKNKEEIKKTKEMQEIEEMSDVAGQICGQDGCCGMGCEDCPCNNGGECMREAMCDYEEFDCGHDHDLEDAEELAVMGRPVDDFLVDAYHEGEIKKVMLSDYEDKWVVLFFYPADFTFVCPTELEDMADYYTKFQKLGAEVLAISTDTAYSHKAWHDTSKAVSKVKFPMLADPTHELAEYYNVLIEEEGLSRRGTFIIDPDGILRSIEINDNSIGRNAKEIYRKLQAAKFVYENGDQVCPAKWETGDKTLTPGDDLVGKI